MGFQGIDINLALYIVAFLAIYLLLGQPAREGMKGKQKNAGPKKQMGALPKKKEDDDDDDDDEKKKYDTVPELVAAAKAFVESQTQGGLKADVTATNRKKKGMRVHVKINGAQGIEFRGRTRVDSADALKSARNMLVKMFASPKIAARVDLADRGFKKGVTSYDTVAALVQGATTALAGAKAQGFAAASIMANKKWDGAADFVHVSVYGRKPGEKKPTFVFRGYSRLDSDATLLAAYQAMQQTLQGLRDAKFKPFLVGNRLAVATASPTLAATVPAGIVTSVVPTLAPTMTPVAPVPPTVSLPPMSSDDPLATMPPLVTAAPM